MKRLTKTAIAALLALVLSASSLSIVAFAGTEVKDPVGDLDHNGEVSDWDAVLFERHLAGWDVTVDEENADLNGDGNVDEKDAVILARYLAGWYGEPDQIAKNSVHVTTDGDDEEGDGTAKNPFASLERARLKVRELLSSGAKGGITVYVHEGEYNFGVKDFADKGDYGAYFTLTEADSGTKDCPVTYTAYGDDEVLLTASLELHADDFEKADSSFTDQIRDASARDKIYKLDLKALGYTEDVADINDNYFTIFYGDQLMDRARYPDRNMEEDEKYTMYTPYVVPVSGQGWFLEEAETKLSDGSFRVNPLSSWSHYNEYQTRGFLNVDYFTGTLNIKNQPFEFIPKGTVIDYTEGGETKHFTCKKDYYKVYYRSGGHPTNNLKHFYYNVVEELNCRGEYYIDSNGILYIYADEDFDNIEIRMTQFTPKGKSDSYRQHLIVLENCDYYTFAGFHIANIRGDAFYGTGDNIVLDGMLIENLSARACSITGMNCTIKNNEVRNSGGEGIELFAPDDSTATLTTCGNEVINNLIHDITLIDMCYTPAIYTSGTGAHIAYNECYQVTHAAFLGGGTDTVFEYNYLHECCYQGGDAGVMYVGGFAGAMTIRYNVIQNTVNNSTGGAPKSLYVDDGGSAYTLFGNIIDCTGGVGIIIGGGSDNIIQNNIMIGTKMTYDNRGYFGEWQDVHGIYGPYSGKEADGSYHFYWNNLYNPQTPEWDYELWNARYPYYAQYKSSNVKDTTDHYLLGVCGGAAVINNVVVWENRKFGLDENGHYRVAAVGAGTQNDVSTPVKLNGVFKDYQIYYTVDELGFVDYENRDLNLKADSKIYEDLPGFQPIPLERIGCDFRPAE